MISNCGHDENGRYSGGKAGDQTGTEWQVINWYSRPWKCVLRHPNAKVRAMIASMCIFRKNCASVPEERSAIPLQTEQSSAG